MTLLYRNNKRHRKCSINVRGIEGILHNIGILPIQILL